MEGAALDYSLARSHGLSNGYNLFTSPPAPKADDAALGGGGKRLLVNLSTLEADMSGIGRRDSAAARQLLSFSPRASLEGIVTALNAAANNVGEVESTMPKAMAACETGYFSCEKEQMRSPPLSREDAVKATADARAAGNAARELVAHHQRACDLAAQGITALDAEWRSAQGEAQAARRAALARMAALEGEVQGALEDVLMRLTDHALLGTAEEAERMARAPGPDGAQLRALKHRQEELQRRQKLQKAVLVQVARKALAATQAHDERIAQARDRLRESADRRADLVEATDGLERALSTLTGEPSPLIGANVATARVERKLSAQRKVSAPQRAASKTPPRDRPAATEKAAEKKRPSLFRRLTGSKKAM